MVNPSKDYLDLVHEHPRDLRRHMVRGATPSTDDLVGREFRGTNVGTAPRMLGIRRFIKGFEATAEGTVVGYNRRVRGADLDAPWSPVPWRGADRFGFFTVSRVDPARRDNEYLHALLLDYGAGLNQRGDPASLLRDYLVSTASGVLLGHAMLAVGPARLPVGFFVLEPL